MNVEDVISHAAITDVLHRYARAMDRMDAELALACWHPGGTDDHAPLFAGTAVDFLEWLWPIHAGMKATRHVISNIVIVLDGDSAGVESYWTVTLRMADPDGALHDILGHGRYVDHFERIAGVWAIRHRQSLHDFDRVDPVVATMSDPAASVTVEANNPLAQPKTVARDRSDYSYSVLRTASR
jgi:hypothetical protein